MEPVQLEPNEDGEDINADKGVEEASPEEAVVGGDDDFDEHGKSGVIGQKEFKKVDKDEDDDLAMEESLQLGASSPSTGRPLGWKSAIECSTYYFSRNPMTYSIPFLLFLVMIDRGISWGVVFTNPGFLTGAYNPDWNPGFSASKAAELSSLSQGIAYAVPFFVAILADGIIGDYPTMLIMLILFEFPGLLLIGLSAIPGLLGDSYPIEVLRAGAMFLYPIGSGGIMAILDMFAAKQFHALIQRDKIEKYFIFSGMASALGGIMGEIFYAPLAVYSIAIMYLVMICFSAVATITYVAGTKRYVHRKPSVKKILEFLKASVGSCFCWKRSGDGSRKFELAYPGPNKLKEENGGSMPNRFIDGYKRLLWVIPVQAVFVPSNICLTCMVQLTIIQAFPMRSPSKYWSGPQMLFFNSFCAFLSGQILNKKVYPFFKSIGRDMSTSTRIAISGLWFCVGFILFAVVDLQIQRVWLSSGGTVSIFWQAIPLIVMGPGVMMLIPSQDELTFIISPTEFKTLGNAINKLVQMALSNVVTARLFSGLSMWFVDEDGSGNIRDTESYVEANVWKFHLVGALIGFLQFVICALPPVNKWCLWLAEISAPKGDD